jgi:hypothetical protein
MKSSQKYQAWVDVAVFESVNDGKMLEAFFKGKGLEVRAYDDKIFRYFLFLRPPRVTYRVQVRYNHLESANEHLEMNVPPAILEKAIHCPSCGSLHVNYPQMTRKFILPTVLLHLGIIFRAIDHECYCESCHHIWNLSQDAAAALVSKARSIKPFPF